MTTEWALPLSRWRTAALAVEATGALLGARLQLSRSTFQEVLARAGFTPLSDPLRAGSQQTPETEPHIRSIRRWVAAAARRLPGSSCLHQALAVHSMLRRRGIEHTIVIGIQESPASPFMAAHSWVDAGGTVASDTPNVTGFSVLTRLGKRPQGRGA